MPQYFFHIDGDELDTKGHELTNVAEAKGEAVKATSAYLSILPELGR